MKKPENNRRSFLKGAAVTTAAVSSGVVTSKALAETKAEVKTKAQGYQETDHVRDYYRLARI